MNEEWWERPVCVVCNYWWALLLALILALAAYFTRDYWLPESLSEPSLGTGDVQVTLRWSGHNDLDLHVTDPSGEVISYLHPTAVSGGTLDVDGNAGCHSNLAEAPVENIFWPEDGAPRGDFQIHVNFYALCTDTLVTPFEVRLLVDGRVSEFNGQVARVGEPAFVTEFDR